LITLVFVVGLGAVHAHAQGAVNTTVNDTFSDWTLQKFFAFILNLILAVGFSLTLIMLAMGFIQYIMAQGDKLGVEKAQKWVTYSVIGGLGLFLVFAIRNAIRATVPGGAIETGEGTSI
jgi:hypothetical protein